MRKVVSVDEMRALERAADSLGLPSAALMENAGRAVADAIGRGGDRPRRALVVAGPGNNGGDGLVLARHLCDAGWDVTVYYVNRPPVDDAKDRLLRQRGVRGIDVSTDPDCAGLATLVAGSDVIVDAVFGTGRRRPILGDVAQVLDRVNAHPPSTRVIAVDVPSGVNADTGEADSHAIAATCTVALGFAKRGLFVGPAATLMGELVVANIGIPADQASSITTSLADAGSIARLLPPRPAISNKGSFGRVLVVAGSKEYTGAPILATWGAQRVGAGLVTLACPESARSSLAVHSVEMTFLPVPDSGTGELGPPSVAPVAAAAVAYDAVVVGPGIGRSDATAVFLGQLLGKLGTAGRPVVLDADALTLLSRRPHWWESLPPNSILTPHPGEMKRLLGGASVDQRIDVAVDSARRWNTVVVLKGAYTVVARPDGHSAILPFAEAALATAGTGDVLAGAIGGLLGQGAPAASAAVAAAYVHGLAGRMVAAEYGPAGGLATDLASRLPSALRQVREAANRTLSFPPDGW